MQYSEFYVKSEDLLQVIPVCLYGFY